MKTVSSLHLSKAYRARYLTEVDNGTPPVAWEVKDFADGWILCLNHADAVREAEDTGATIRNLYRKTT
jgi:hypothetical protein